MTIRWLPTVADINAPTPAELAAGRDLTGVIERVDFDDCPICRRPWRGHDNDACVEAAALTVLGQESGWRLAGHEYGVVVRGPIVADCSDLAIDAVRALEHRGWAMPWDHWHDDNGEIEAWHGHLTLLSPGVAAAQRLTRDLATALLKELLVDVVRTWRGKAGRADRIAYRRRQLARRRRNRR